MKLVYLAGPYRAKTTRAITQNINRAREYAIKLWQAGYAVLCPHLNSAHFDGCVEDARFLKGGLLMLQRCDAIAVMPGSEASEGTQAEIAEARRLGMEFIEVE